MENSLTMPFNPLTMADESTTDFYAAELMRNNVREIIGSYHHQFDHLYECVQNAVDACEKAYNLKKAEVKTEYTPTVKVRINLQENSVTLIDNGIGMSKDVVLKYFFTPFATLKSVSNQDAELRQRGEKGVGASFLSYGSNFIHISTLSIETKEVVSGYLENALKWCNQQIDLTPMPQVMPCDPHEDLEKLEHGTVITIKFSEDTNISNLVEHSETIDQWEALLRLNTALGYVDLQKEDDFLSALTAILEVTDEDGSTRSQAMRTGYLYPHLTTDSDVRLSALARDRQGRLSGRQRDMDVLWEEFSYAQVYEKVASRLQTARYMRQKTHRAILDVLSFYQPEAYVALTWSSDFWEDKNHRIWGEEKEGLLRPGIVFATKSQKIGEPKRIDFTFRSGDFNRFFILLHMKNLRGDIGRKSLREEIGLFANFFANAVQRSEFIENDDCLRPSPGPFDEQLEGELEELKEGAYNRPDLSLSDLNFVKVPVEEQDVVALFFDLLGAKKIRGYQVFSTHISRTYDGVGRFQLDETRENTYDSSKNRLGIAGHKFRKGWVKSPSRAFIEFKYSSDGLVRDVRSGYKRLQDVKWLVCWEIGDRHVNEGIGITDITESAQVNQRDYHGVTHIMTENQDKVYVICLKKVLEILSTQ